MALALPHYYCILLLPLNSRKDFWRVSQLQKCHADSAESPRPAESQLPQSSLCCTTEHENKIGASSYRDKSLEFTRGICKRIMKDEDDHDDTWYKQQMFEIWPIVIHCQITLHGCFFTLWCQDEWHLFSAASPFLSSGHPVEVLDSCQLGTCSSDTCPRWTTMSILLHHSVPGVIKHG